MMGLVDLVFARLRGVRETLAALTQHVFGG